MKFTGEYQDRRVHALVETEGKDGFKITIEWGDRKCQIKKV